jgi:type IV secretory pathway TrbF-like protein
MIINEPFSPTLGPLRQDPEPETPYQKAAQVWDDRIGQPASRPATGGSLLLAI